MNPETTAKSTYSAARLRSIQKMANRLRRHSLISTSEAGSGHPSTCLSCAELMAGLFFNKLRFDVENPKNPLNDRVVLSKGHGAPIYWAAWAEAGAFPVEKLLTLRQIDSDLEGHPTPRSPWADVATGSLGQGLSIGLGMAISFRLDKLPNRVYVLTGDGELAEGSVWEAAMLASHSQLSNLTAILDINGYGQSQATMYGHDASTYQARFESFGWKSRVIDGHDVAQVLEALDWASGITEAPSVIIAKTLKGKGVSFMEDKDGWHGKPVAKGEQLEQALAEVGTDLEFEESLGVAPANSAALPQDKVVPPLDPEFAPSDKLATREAYGLGLAALGKTHPKLVVLDGDTKNSTYSEKFLAVYPERFLECFIAESNMVGIGVGLSALGKTPFASTFACFLTRGYDQIRMGAVSQASLKLCGSHCGVSIGEDGPSQMGLEDLAMMRAISGSTVFYPSDATSAFKLVAVLAGTPGLGYLRTTRPKTPILYSNSEPFKAGGSKTLRSSDSDRATIVAAGITLHEALAAHRILADQGIPVRIIDLYSVKPLDEATLRRAVRETGAIITVEDHYPEGGLGDAVCGALAGESFRYRKLAVYGLPRSGPPAELMSMFAIDAASIVKAVTDLLG